MRGSRFACAIALLLGLCLVPARSETLRCGLTGGAMPRGLVVVFPSGERTYRAMPLDVLKNPWLSGVAVQVNWRDIEPIPGKPDWAALDALFAAAEASKKWVRLAIFPGFFAPPWALEGAETDEFVIQYGPDHGKQARLAMPWDRVYLGRWFAFMKEVSARYGASPAFRIVAASGPTSVSEETTLPNQPDAHRRWLVHGYTLARYLDAWDEAFRFFAAAFPNQCVSLAGLNLQILGPGQQGPAAHLRAKQEIVQRAFHALGDRLAIQWNDLHAGHAAVEAPDNIDFIKSYIGRLITGFEMRSQSQKPDASRVMGAAGDPPLALRRSIDKGMTRNALGRHVDYLEIYVADAIPADMQSVLQYAASQLQR